jgi:hypothetical protein
VSDVADVNCMIDVFYLMLIYCHFMKITYLNYHWQVLYWLILLYGHQICNRTGLYILVSLAVKFSSWMSTIWRLVFYLTVIYLNPYIYACWLFRLWYCCKCTNCVISISDASLTCMDWLNEINEIWNKIYQLTHSSSPKSGR